MAGDPIGAVDGIKGRGALEASRGAAGLQSQQVPRDRGAAAAASPDATRDGVHLSDELREEAQVVGEGAPQESASANHIKALLGQSSGADASNREPGLQRGGVMTPEGWSGQEPGMTQGFVATSEGKDT